MEFAKWYLEAHIGLRWKRKYLQFKTGKKRSEKLLCVLLIHLTELQLSPREAFRYDCSCVIRKVIFGSPYRVMVKKGISSVRNCIEAFWETALFSVNSSHRVTAFLSRSLSQRLFLRNLQRDIWKPLEGYGENEISSVKNCKEAFWETCLFSVNSSHRVTAFPSRSLSLRLFLWNLQSVIWMPIDGYGEKGNIFR